MVSNKLKAVVRGVGAATASTATAIPLLPGLATNLTSWPSVGTQPGLYRAELAIGYVLALLNLCVYLNSKNCSLPLEKLIWRQNHSYPLPIELIVPHDQLLTRKTA